MSNSTTSVICPYPDCGKVFDRLYNMQVHYRLHTGETPYECPLKGCNQRFKWRSSLAHHKRQHKKRGDVMTPSPTKSSSPLTMSDDSSNLSRKTLFKSPASIQQDFLLQNLAASKFTFGQQPLLRQLPPNICQQAEQRSHETPILFYMVPSPGLSCIDSDASSSITNSPDLLEEKQAVEIDSIIDDEHDTMDDEVECPFVFHREQSSYKGDSMPCLNKNSWLDENESIEDAWDSIISQALGTSL